MGEKNNDGTLEKDLGSLLKSAMSCDDCIAGFFFMSANGVYAVPIAEPLLASRLKFRFIDHDMRILHPMMRIRTNASTAPTTMKTKFSGSREVAR